MIAFMKKEWMENVRTGRIWILLILFGLFGVMNPAIAKLTPWIQCIFWDNSVVAYPLFASFCYWLFGLWMLAILVFFSASMTSNVQVLLR